jgi:hypothetical protein
MAGSAISDNLNGPGKIRINQGLNNGLITADINSTFDIGQLSDIFDGNYSTLARTPGINPLSITLNFKNGAILNGLDLYFGTDGKWTVESALSSEDLKNKTGSYLLHVNRPINNNTLDSVRFTDRMVNFVKLTALRTVGDDYVHLNEWTIYGTADLSIPAEPCPSLSGIDFSVREGVKIYGLKSPVISREQLNCLEDSLTKTIYPDLKADLFRPQDPEDAKLIQDYRQAHWEKSGEDYVRRFEFIVSEKAIGEMQNKFGNDLIGSLIRHIPAINDIWKSSRPSLNFVAKLDRIIIVSENLVSPSGGGWHVVNNKGYSYWANDELNGKKGDIPYDIDSRWVIDEDITKIFHQFKEFYGCEGIANCRIDYGLLHELTHHLPVGDNYHFNFGDGNNILIDHPDGKTFRYKWHDLTFMPNDHMSAPDAKLLTAPSTYHIKFYHQLNPEVKRTPQDYIYEPTHVYGNYFYDTLTITLTGLEGSGIDEVLVMKEQIPDQGGDRKLVNTDLIISRLYDGKVVKIKLNKSQQQQFHPGLYIGLKKGDVIVPVYIAQNILQTLYWENALQNKLKSSSEFKMQITDQLNAAIAYLNSISNTKADTVDVWPGLMRAYVYNNPYHRISDVTVASGSLDNLNNIYAFEFIPDRFAHKGNPEITISTDTGIYTAPADINIKADAWDIDGTIEKVVFWNDETVIGTDYTYPYSFTWKGIQDGKYSIKAEVTDNTLNTSLSNYLLIKVTGIITGTDFIPENSNNILLYPNPAIHHTVLSVKAEKSQKIQISILNTQAEIIQTKEAAINAGENFIDLELNGLSNGMYFISVKGIDTDFTEKIIISQ